VAFRIYGLGYVMEIVSGERVRRGWRSRWAAVGAAAAVSLGAGGGFLIADAANGPESGIVMVDPVRILDTRDPVNVGLPGPFISPIAQKLQVTGPVPATSGTQTVVPPGATGVLLNVTAVGTSADGFISIRPGDATGAPATSSLNVTAGVTVPNAVQVALPTTGTNAGKIDITWDALGVAGPTTDILIDVVGHTLAADSYTKAEIDALLAPTVGPGVLRLPASSFQPAVVGAGNTLFYKWNPEFNSWSVVNSAPTTLCYMTEAELPSGARFDLMKASYASDGSHGGTVTLYRSNGGFNEDPAVSVAELPLPAPIPSGARQAETNSFAEAAVIAGDVYLAEVCQGWSRSFKEVQIHYTVPG
jgi:hypothetical protein